MSSITNLEVYVPKKRIMSEELYEHKIITQDEWLGLQQRGIHSTPIEEEKNAIEMITQVLDPLFQQKDVQRENIKYLFMPYLYYSFPQSYDLYGYLARKYHLPKMTSYSIRDLACTNFLVALYISWTLLKDSSLENSSILLVSVEKCVELEERYGGSYFITGDAATSLLISGANHGDRILDVQFIADNSTIQEGKQKRAVDAIANYSYFINFGKLLRKVQNASGVHLNDIKLFIPNNTSVETWIYLAKILKLPLEKFFLQGVAEIGHMNNCDLMLNLNEVYRSNLLQKGDYYVLLSLGNGGVIGCALCQKG